MSSEMITEVAGSLGVFIALLIGFKTKFGDKKTDKGGDEQ